MKPVIAALLIGAVWIGGGRAPQALEFKISENQMIVTGKIYNTDALDFNRTLDKNPKVDTIVLRQMPGGKVTAMEGIAATVEDKKLNTIVSGICVSACAHIFLAGEKRQFSDDFPLSNSYLGFHGVYPAPGSGGWMTDVPDGAERWYMERSGGKLDPELVLDWLRISRSSGMARFFHPELKTRFGVVSFLCEKRKALGDCRRFQKTALDYGIITTAALGHVKDTPYWTPGLYKQTELNVSELLQGNVLNDANEEIVEEYMKDGKRRAMVMSDDGKWLFWNSNKGLKVTIAMAIFRCRMSSDTECNVIALDGNLTKTPLQIERIGKP